MNDNPMEIKWMYCNCIWVADVSNKRLTIAINEHGFFCVNVEGANFPPTAKTLEEAQRQALVGLILLLDSQVKGLKAILEGYGEDEENNDNNISI